MTGTRPPRAGAGGGDAAAGCARDFERQYQQAMLPEMLALERRVTGCAYGGTSWTTRAEADRIAALLGLRPGVRLLEIGAGAGWPGLYLADATGCEVVLTDLPRSALALARVRAAADGLQARCDTAVADAGALPFAAGGFDRLGHSDVLCCLPHKQAVLAECRRVARDGALMVFSVIAPAPSLDEARRRAAVAAGPPFVETPVDYAPMLQAAGWRLRGRFDVTGDYTDSNRRFLSEMRARAPQLIEALGEQEWVERVRRREGALAALEAGLLRREIFVVTPVG